MGRHITYANVVATLALVFAMTGGAYALVVNGALVVDESLTEADIRNGSLSSSIAPDAINSARVQDDSLTGSDVDESTLQLPAAPGRAGFFASGERSWVGSTETVIAERNLPPGRYVLSGAATVRFLDRSTTTLCHFRDASTHTAASSTPDFDRTEWMTLPVVATADRPAGGPVQLVCRATTEVGPEPSAVVRAAFTATQVDSLG